MNRVDSMEDYQSEKAIIDALLKISEIVQKTEANRRHQKHKHSKKTVGDGDCNAFYVDHEQHQEVPMPPPMRTLDSYVSGLNQQSSNCNQTSTHRPKELPSSRSLSSSSRKRRCYDSSYTSSLLNDHRKRSARYRSNNNSQLVKINPNVC